MRLRPALRRTHASVTAGQWVHVFSSHGCHDAIDISGATIETDGQIIGFTL